jgi:tripartite-type tricarboxylate transporter receptor subunit TctC
MPDVVERLAAEGVDPWGATPKQFRDHVAAEIPRWKAVTEAARIDAQR